jgi:hypothetical protein
MFHIVALVGATPASVIHVVARVEGAASTPSTDHVVARVGTTSDLVCHVVARVDGVLTLPNVAQLVARVAATSARATHVVARVAAVAMVALAFHVVLRVAVTVVEPAAVVSVAMFDHGPWPALLTAATRKSYSVLGSRPVTVAKRLVDTPSGKVAQSTAGGLTFHVVALVAAEAMGACAFHVVALVATIERLVCHVVAVVAVTIAPGRMMISEHQSVLVMVRL